MQSSSEKKPDPNAKLWPSWMYDVDSQRFWPEIEKSVALVGGKIGRHPQDLLHQTTSFLEALFKHCPQSDLINLFESSGLFHEEQRSLKNVYLQKGLPDDSFEDAAGNIVHSAAFKAFYEIHVLQPYRAAQEKKELN